MKSNHSDLSNQGINDPCCGEIIILNKLKLKIRKYARWILGLMALSLIIIIALGYLLDPETIRILWIGISAALLIIFLPLVILIGRRTNQCFEENGSD